MKDTHSDIEKKLRQMYRERTHEERLEMQSNMFDAAKEIILSSLPADLPDSEKRIQLFLRLYKNDFDENTLNDIICWLRERG